jgi:DNA primase
MSVVDAVKDRLDIIEVISSYVPLQKSGRNFKANCPFHSEKTPSFVVFPDSQRWHCFGACSEGGDVFTFVMKQEGWDFRTALAELAARAGVELQPRTPARERAEQEADRLRSALQAAAELYHSFLLTAAEAQTAREYVARRGLSSETVDRFMLGYSPQGWDTLRNSLISKGYTADELLRAGLLVERESRSGTYDRFRDRLMIPIRDGRGHVIAFGGRTLDPEGLPKYINSPQTALFDKSTVLYGLDAAHQSIRSEERAIIVEGYMDVMQAHQAGFTNVVAQMGTALTEAQLRQLQRGADVLVLALDPDAAGVQATLRGVDLARETLSQEWEPVFDPQGLLRHEARLGTEIRVLQLPPGQDPDDLIREQPERWAELVDRALPVVDFHLSMLLDGLDLEDTKAKARAVDSLLPLLRAVANPVERDDYVQKTARALRLDVRSLQRQVRRSPQASRRRAEETATGDAAVVTQGRTQSDLEEYCLSILLRRPDVLASVNDALAASQLERLRGEDFTSPGLRAVFEMWEALVDFGHAGPTEALRAQLPPELHDLLAELLTKDVPVPAEEQLARDVTLALLRLRERNLRRLGMELGFLTAEAQELGDLRADQYVGALRAYRKALLNTQQALATRRAWTGLR